MKYDMQLIYNPYHLLLCCDGLIRDLIKVELSSDKEEDLYKATQKDQI